MSDNPYRFTVEVCPNVDRTLWFVDVATSDGVLTDYFLNSYTFATEAEANEHAELIRQAMREVS